MPSGKQVLLNFLREFSQRPVADAEMEEVSEKLRIALLLHGSTPGSMWFHVDRLAWVTENDEVFPNYKRQGLGLRDKSILFSDILLRLLDKAEDDQEYRKEFDELTDEEYRTALHSIKLLMTSFDFCSTLNQVEQDNSVEYQLAVEKFIRSYKSKLQQFRINPGEFLDADDELLGGYKKGFL